MPLAHGGGPGTSQGRCPARNANGFRCAHIAGHDGSHSASTIITTWVAPGSPDDVETVVPSDGGQAASPTPSDERAATGLFRVFGSTFVLAMTVGTCVAGPVTGGSPDGLVILLALVAAAAAVVAAARLSDDSARSASLGKRDR